jgi:hypothetical protein
MTDNNTNWNYGGTPFKQPEWKSGGPSHPITHTRHQNISIDLELEATPAGAGRQSAKLVGRGPDYLSFEDDITIRSGGRFTVSMVAKKTLPDEIKVLQNVSVAWHLDLKNPDGSTKKLTAGTSRHTIYLTWGTPRSEGWPEDGVTLKRMRKAVELTNPLGTLDPHGIVRGLMGLFRYYTLTRDPSAPAGHPRYSLNAWPMADAIAATGECQAIVRFVRAVVYQVGCAGTVEAVVVWAEPPNGFVPKEAAWGRGGLYFFNRTPQVINGEVCTAGLADGPVVEGRVYPPQRPPPAPPDPNAIGWNNFEACLKFTHGTVKYYGGGAGIYDTPNEVLRAFHALCWVTSTEITPGVFGTKVVKVVAKYI